MLTIITDNYKRLTLLPCKKNIDLRPKIDFF